VLAPYPCDPGSVTELRGGPQLTHGGSGVRPVQLGTQTSMPKRQFDRLEQLTQHVAAATLEPACAAGGAGKLFDLVLADGRVIDPESGAL
jgi:hypothetical protein